MTQKEIVCIGCPLGCLVKLKLDSTGNAESLSGNQCKKGQEYALAEFQHPIRVLTTTVLTEGARQHLLAVRTDRPVSKEKLKEIMRATTRIRVKPPVKAGQEIVHDVLGTGANLISTGNLNDQQL
jgi:CxxC motif-containing protein